MLRVTTPDNSKPTHLTVHVASLPGYVDDPSND